MDDDSVDPELEVHGEKEEDDDDTITVGVKVAKRSIVTGQIVDKAAAKKEVLLAPPVKMPLEMCTLGNKKMETTPTTQPAEKLVEQQAAANEMKVKTPTRPLKLSAKDLGSKGTLSEEPRGRPPSAQQTRVKQAPTRGTHQLNRYWLSTRRTSRLLPVERQPNRLPRRVHLPGHVSGRSHLDQKTSSSQ